MAKKRARKAPAKTVSAPEVGDADIGHRRQQAFVNVEGDQEPVEVPEDLVQAILKVRPQSSPKATERLSRPIVVAALVGFVGWW